MYSTRAVFLMKYTPHLTLPSASFVSRSHRPEGVFSAISSRCMVCSVRSWNLGWFLVSSCCTHESDSDPCGQQLVCFAYLEWVIGVQMFALFERTLGGCLMSTCTALGSPGNVRRGSLCNVACSAAAPHWAGDDPRLLHHQMQASMHMFYSTVSLSNRSY